MIPFGFIPNIQGWNKKTTLYLGLLYRGKYSIKPVNLVDMPSTWNGKGSLALEGTSLDSLAILTSSSPKFVVQGQVGREITNFEEFQIEPTSTKIYYSLVGKDEKIAQVLVGKEEIWALWEDSQNKWMGFELIDNINDTLPGGFLSRPGRLRRFDYPEVLGEINLAVKKVVSAQISL